MKLRVIAWVDYREDVEWGSISCAAYNAIVDDIKRNGYSFSGWSHQEAGCCTPVLNNGKKYCFSQRGWGGLMAEAHGYTGMMDYSLFAVAGDREKEIRPPIKLYTDEFVPETDLNERIALAVSEELFSAVQKKRKIKLDDLPALRYLDAGDTLAFTFGGESAEYTVRSVERQKDLTEAQMDKIVSAYYGRDPEEQKRAEKQFEEAKTVLFVQLANPKK